MFLIKDKYDVIIVGAGPAGLFCAYELVMNSDLAVLVVDKGKAPLERCRNAVDIMCGVGGAGCMSDGKLNINPYIGGDLPSLVGSEELSNNLIEYVDSIFVEFGAPQEMILDSEKTSKLVQKASQAGIRYIPVRQKHIGSDRLPILIDKMQAAMILKQCDFLLETTVEDILVENGVLTGVVLSSGKKILSSKVVLAPGRIGNEWFNKLVERNDLETIYNPIDVGVRVETNFEVYKNLTDVNYDPKIHIYTDRYKDFVRTFCTNPRGFVATEDYDGFIGVNGHAERDRKSSNTNFALLNRVQLTKPLENTFKYGKSIAQLATTIGGGKVILQTLGDLRRGRRSTAERIKKSFVEPTLKDYTPGDISMALPSRIVHNLLEALEKLDSIAPGINSDNTLLYAPEIKYHSIKARHDSILQSVKLKNLFFAGDGAGLTRDIINAAATGVFVARKIIEK
ncbi:NAD(P)/FAD-dependent oxidoreductase [Candidatus Woesearchaeota archaeon]|nr:NAD(P)/FAD-dependent oxidoreductase [Candidatus Woesearchaeota archaeon]